MRLLTSGLDKLQISTAEKKHISSTRIIVILKMIWRTTDFMWHKILHRKCSYDGLENNSRHDIWNITLKCCSSINVRIYTVLILHMGCNFYVGLVPYS